jgi:hypothetical protein
MDPTGTSGRPPVGWVDLDLDAGEFIIGVNRIAAFLAVEYLAQSREVSRRSYPHRISLAAKLPAAQFRGRLGT